MNRRTFLGNILTLGGAAIIKPPPLIFDMGANQKIYTLPDVYSVWKIPTPNLYIATIWTPRMGSQTIGAYNAGDTVAYYEGTSISPGQSLLIKHE